MYFRGLAEGRRSRWRLHHRTGCKVELDDSFSPDFAGPRHPGDVIGPDETAGWVEAQACYGRCACHLKNLRPEGLSYRTKDQGRGFFSASAMPASASGAMISYPALLGCTPSGLNSVLRPPSLLAIAE